MEVQLKNHLSKFSLLPSTQSGFRKGYSCTTALLHIVDDIIRSTDQGKCTVLVLLDFSRAFDTINYDLLLSISHYMGLSETAISLLDKYLKNRQQKVIMDKLESRYLPLSSGVPQGSILGPLLFCMYSSNILRSIDQCSVHLYADDTQIYYSFPPQTNEIACIQINEDLQSFVNLCTDHCLNINASKSNVMLFGSKNNRDKVSISIDIRINGESLELVHDARSLGVLLDDNLRFEKHVNRSIQRAYSTLKMIYGNRHYLSTKLKSILCDALVLSLFNYADSLYGPCLTSQYVKKIQKVQNSCLRLIYGIRKYERISHKLSDIGWLNMKNRRIHHAANLFHKILSTKTPLYLHRKITHRSDVHTLNIRFKGTLTPPKFKTEQFKRSFSYQICEIHNSVPTNIRNGTSVNFRKKFRDYLFDRQR